jgi:hypothetical protein
MASASPAIRARNERGIEKYFFAQLTGLYLT